jgi:hypothetical protein
MRRFRRIMISIIATGLASYVISFYAMRFGVRASGYPLMYIFSSDPVKNQLLHRFFSPMIVIAGGVSSLPPEVGDSEYHSTRKEKRSVYLIGNEPLFGRIAAHYDAFLRAKRGHSTLSTK